MSRKEQEAMCLRYFDKDLVLVKNLLVCFAAPNLDINRLLGQAYDGKANIAEKYNGTQDIVRK